MSSAKSQSQFETTNLVYLLLGDLREALAARLDEANNRRWTIAVVDQLLTALNAEADAMHNEGYLSGVCEEWPNWSNQVEQLSDERSLLRAQLPEQPASRVPRGGQVPGVCAELLDLAEQGGPPGNGGGHADSQRAQAQGQTFVPADQHPEQSGGHREVAEDVELNRRRCEKGQPSPPQVSADAAQRGGQKAQEDPARGVLGLVMFNGAS